MPHPVGMQQLPNCANLKYSYLRPHFDKIKNKLKSTLVCIFNNIINHISIFKQRKVENYYCSLTQITILGPRKRGKLTSSYYHNLKRTVRTRICYKLYTWRYYGLQYNINFIKLVQYHILCSQFLLFIVNNIPSC